MSERSDRWREGPILADSARLAWLHLRVGAMNELHYRVNFWIQLVQSLLSIGTSLVVLALIYQRTDELDGWTCPELLALMGVFTIMGGVIKTIIQPNMQRLMGDVRMGTFDFLLTKPADAQVLASVREFRLWQLTDVLVGAVVLAVALVQIGERIGVSRAVTFAVTLGLGTVMIYCFWLIVTTGAFWFVRLEQVQELFEGLYRAGQFPVGIYPGWLRYGLTFLVPIAFAVTVPSEALTDRLGAGGLAFAAAAAIVLVVATRLIWRWGLRHYSGASA